MMNLQLLETSILLCVNLSASGLSSHKRLIPLVKPVCLKILRSMEVTDRLRGNTILLLANLSMTVSIELRALGVGTALLDLVRGNRVSKDGKSVAESVIIFLHGHEKCAEIDALMEREVVEKYCVPILQHALEGTQFRCVYPYLLYSAKLFKVLARTREYAEALVAEEEAIRLLLRANHREHGPRRLASDIEGRSFALEALTSFARFGLWPSAEVFAEEEAVHINASDSWDPDEQLLQRSEPRGVVAISRAFLRDDLPVLLEDDSCAIRRASIGLWGTLNSDDVVRSLIVGRWLEDRLRVPQNIWRWKVLSYIYPFLEDDL